MDAGARRGWAMTMRGVGMHDDDDDYCMERKKYLNLEEKKWIISIFMDTMIYDVESNRGSVSTDISSAD